MTNNIQSIFSPNSVAIVGASDNPNELGGRTIHYLRKFKFKGDIFPVTKFREEIQGIKAYCRLSAINRVPDAVIIAIDGDQIISTVRICAQMGVKLVIIMSSGFVELGQAGRRRERELVEIAKASGMRLMGPNSQGVANFLNGAILSFNAMFMEVGAKDGPIAIVSQNGIANTVPYHVLRSSGYGVRYVVATGNDIDIGACEIVENIAKDSNINLILIDCQSISEPKILARAAVIARDRGAYIVALENSGNIQNAKAMLSNAGVSTENKTVIDASSVDRKIWHVRDINEVIRAMPLYLRGCDSVKEAASTAP